MTFSNCSLTILTSIKYEEYVDITIVNDNSAIIPITPDPTHVYLMVGQICREMASYSAIPHGWRLRLFGWMVGEGATQDITFVADDGDILHVNNLLTVTATEDVVSVITQFFLDWCETDPVVSTYAKVFKSIRSPYKFITTRPQALFTIPDSDVKFAQIGSNEMEWDMNCIMILIDDLRTEVDLQRHDTFIKRFCDYLSNNPNLDNRFGVIDVDIVKWTLPDERMDNIYLHQSSVIMKISVIPSYTP